MHFGVAIIVGCLLQKYKLKDITNMFKYYIFLNLGLPFRVQQHALRGVSPFPGQTRYSPLHAFLHSTSLSRDR